MVVAAWGVPGVLIRIADTLPPYPPAPVDSKKKHHAGDRRHLVGKRQEQDDAENNGQTGNRREDGTDEDTQVDPDEILNGKQHFHSRDDILEHILFLLSKILRSDRNGMPPR